MKVERLTVTEKAPFSTKACRVWMLKEPPSRTHVISDDVFG